jgi:hypothetical protein
MFIGPAYRLALNKITSGRLASFIQRLALLGQRQEHYRQRFN